LQPALLKKICAPFFARIFPDPGFRPMQMFPAFARILPRHPARKVRDFSTMSKPVVPVEIRTVLPFNSGRAVFIGNPDKVFVIYVDESVGAAISMFMNRTPKERPLTHDLIGHLMTALGAKVERVIINDLKSETYFARLIVSAENQLFEKKIIELDGRPSDCIALAIQQNAPIYVSRDPTSRGEWAAGRSRKLR
jgi:bifunctional DNase/RNase